MKKFLPIFFIGVICTFNAHAQVSFSDNFDQLTSGQYLAKYDTPWTTWSKAPGGTDDILVSNAKAHSGSNSVYFASSASPGGPSDIVLPFSGGAYNTGSFTYGMWMFVDANKKAYFNLQEQSTVGKGWSFDANFDSIGNLTFVNTISGTMLSTTYPQNVWFNIQIKVNLNSNTWNVYINNVLKGSFTNSYRAIASIDIYPMTNSSFYVDDVSYTYTPYTKPSVNAAVTFLYNLNGFLASQNVIPQVEIRNMGTSNITSATIQTSYNGTVKTKTVSGISVASLSYDTINLDAITLVAGSNYYTATITQVNGGADNDTSDNSKWILVNPVVPALGKLVIAEEATGTWCQWCPRGAVFMKQMSEKYAGLFQGIAVHNNDPMTYGNYDKGFAAPSYPDARVDRGTWYDPSGMETDILTRLSVAPKAMITNGAQFNATTKELKVCFKTKFVQAASGNYRIACVLVEDSVTGTASSYNQANTYSGGSKGVMGGFELLPNPVPAAKMVYDHVGRIISPNFLGLPNAFSSTINAGDSFIHNFTFTLDPTWNYAMIKIVGMVIDPAGRIDNGSSTSISTAAATGYWMGTNVLATQQLDAPDNVLKIYPNPVNVELTVQLNHAGNIRVFNIRGESVYENQLPNASDIRINTEHWANGMYIIEMNDGERIVTKKIVKE